MGAWLRDLLFCLFLDHHSLRLRLLLLRLLPPLLLLLLLMLLMLLLLLPQFKRCKT